jgi:hypothetical protein
MENFLEDKKLFNNKCCLEKSDKCLGAFPEEKKVPLHSENILRSGLNLKILKKKKLN